MVSKLPAVMLQRLHSTVVSNRTTLATISSGPTLFPLQIMMVPSIEQKSWQSTPALDQQSHVEFPSNVSSTSSSTIPKYLYDEYWWAYVNPMAIRTLDRQYLVNMVLWGNAAELRDAALNGLGSHGSQELEKETKTHDMIHGRTLQVACVYGNFTETLLQRMAPGASLHVIDVVAGQIENLMRKVGIHQSSCSFSCSNADTLDFDEHSFDQIVLFFLLHEIPNSVRIQALKEATRVLKPNGKIVLLDFHRPQTLWHKTWMAAWFAAYEPFAMDLWNHEIADWLPPNMTVHKQVLSGGLYQKIVATKH